MRAKTPAPVNKAIATDSALLAQTSDAANQLAVIRSEQSQQVLALARHLNYSGSTDPAVLENSAKDAIRRIGAGIFELGGYLLLLKEACKHGEFLPALDRLRLEPRAAQRYMTMTQRFANTSTSTHLEAAGMSKLAELLPLDDEQTAELVEFGQTGELALDDVARMSVRELRAAVYKERHKSAKKEVEIERLESVNAELHAEARRIKRLKPEQIAPLLDAEAQEVLAETLGRLRGDFRHTVETLLARPDANATLVAGLVGQVQAVLSALRDEFNLPDVAGDGTPEWQKWAAANGAATVPDVPAAKSTKKPAH